MPSRRLLRLLLAAVGALLLATALGACNKEKVVTRADTEGTYLDIGPMKYQIQISRQLNPSIPEDRTFLEGIPAAESKLAGDEVWFAVFVRVENDKDQPETLATDYEISDTEDNVYRPITLAPTNPLAYRTGNVGPKSVAPDPDSVAGQVGINGMELLFKIKRRALDNKPVEFVVKSPTLPQVEGTVTLDI